MTIIRIKLFHILTFFTSTVIILNSLKDFLECLVCWCLLCYRWIVLLHRLKDRLTSSCKMHTNQHMRLPCMKHVYHNIHIQRMLHMMILRKQQLGLQQHVRQLGPLRRLLHMCSMNKSPKRKGRHMRCNMRYNQCSNNRWHHQQCTQEGARQW